MSTQEEQASLGEDIAEAYGATAEDGSEVETTETQEAAPAEEPGIVEEPALEPHPMWKSQYRKLFEEMGGIDGGRNYQQGMLDLYKETDAFAQERAQEAAKFRKQLDPWNEIFNPINQQLAMMGTDPHTFVRQLVGYYGQLQANPAQTILQLAQQFGVDLEQAIAERPYTDPATSALEQRLNQLEGARHREMVESRQQESNRIMQQIQTFAGETDASGNLTHPHFEQVQENMTRLINGGVASDLESAYKTACKLQEIPATQAKGDDEAEKAKQEAARKAAQAKKEVQAAKRTVGKTTGKDDKPAKLRDDITAAYRSQAA